MHSVDLLEEALRLAMNSGFQIRQEWLSEQGGGLCRLGERWVLFVDLSLSAQEQLENVVQALRNNELCQVDDTTSDTLRTLLHCAPAESS